MPHHNEIQAIADAIAAGASAESLAREWLDDHGADIPAGEQWWYDIGGGGRQLAVLSGWQPLNSNPLAYFAMQSPGQ